jgi:adenylate cyclase
MKKIVQFSLICISIFMIIMFFYREFYDDMNSINAKIRDVMFNLRGEEDDSKLVVIVDIDDDSLDMIGQWPWSRDKMSKIVQNLTNAGALVIGFDVVFAEEDRTSPARIFAKYNIIREDLPDYDVDFAKSVLSSTVVFGYKFLQEKSRQTLEEPPLTPATTEEIGLTKQNDHTLKANGILQNIPILQDSSYSNGFFNIDFTNTDSTIRSAPLIMKYDNRLYPSFALELYRTAIASKKIKVHYDSLGVSGVELDDVIIPTDVNGRIDINFRGGAKTFKYVSASSVLNNSFNELDIKNKIILVGTSATGIYDMRTTPFSANQAGVEVHANIIDNILVGDFISKPGFSILVDVFRIAVIVLMLMLAYVIFSVYYFIVFAIALFILDALLVYYLLFEKGVITNLFISFSTILSLFIAVLIRNYYAEVKKTNNIRSKLASKVSKGVMEDILNNQDPSSFNVKEKEVTVFFSDIRDFTSIAEEFDDGPKLVKMLNAYIDPMTNIIMNKDGIIDKYIGDSIMAYWNAPIDVANHADKAVSAALKQLKELEHLNIKFKKDGLPELTIGIGINTGKVVVGEMGSKIRSDYTIIGDSVNLGARLESLCKFYKCPLLISEFTHNKLIGKYTSMYIDRVAVKGKQRVLDIYHILDSGRTSRKLQEEISVYNKAVKLYKEENFKNAYGVFKILLSIKGSDYLHLYKIYINRCATYIKTPPTNFDGVYIHHMK